MPELRRDPVVGRWVIVSTERARRPSDFGNENVEEKPQFCPFCPGNEDKTPPEIIAYHAQGREKNKPGWWVRVVPNKYPVLQVEGSLNRRGMGMYDQMNGVGAHEVIIESPDHTKEIHELENSKVEDILWAYRDRIVDLKKDKRFEYILIFKNKGTAAGASLSHPHSQLIAMPMVPLRVKQKLAGAKHYHEYKERCVYCDMVQQELRDNARVISENDDFLAFEPFAPRFPFETWVLPRVHDSNFEDLQKHEVVNLAHMMKTVLKKLAIVLDNPSYNFMVNTAPLKEMDIPYYHWHIEIIPKIIRIAGFEWGTGFYINPTPPEEAAKFLKEAE